MSRNQKKRRRWLAEDKLRIVLAGLEPGVEVSELCRREGINPTQYYGWRKTLLSEHREKVKSVIDLLSTPGVIDELGIGVWR